VSGGVFNPAVGTGITLLGVLTGGTVALYIVTQLVAGAVAGMVFRILHPGE